MLQIGLSGIASFGMYAALTHFSASKMVAYIACSALVGLFVFAATK